MYRSLSVVDYCKILSHESLKNFINKAYKKFWISEMFHVLLWVMKKKTLKEESFLIFVDKIQEFRKIKISI